MTDGALSDVRVIDLSQGIAGPFCTKLLADSGANVIKIEPPDGGDVSRRYGPFPEDVPHLEKSGLFLHLNTSKKSVTLDISTASGVVVLRKLLAHADVLVESYQPGHLATLGLGYDDLKADFPDLVYVSITPFGQTGPYRDFKGNSMTALALSGLMYVTGNPDREPLCTATEPADYFAGFCAWIATLAALAHRAKEGGGQHVDVSLLDALGAADEYNTAFYSFLGGIRRRYYSRHTFTYPSDIYPCKDGYITVIPAAQGFPTLMAILVERPELAEHPLFLSNWDRTVRWQEFDELITPWLLEHGWREILERAQELRMPFAPAPTIQELAELPHLQEREAFCQVEHPYAGSLTQIGAPFKLSQTPLQPGPAPTLGEHNPQVLAEVGYDKQDLLVMRERGVI